jgi:cysteine synthase A
MAPAQESSRLGLGVFEGPTALADFLNPNNHPPLPLVELPERLNPFHAQGVRIFGKLMYLLPLLNMKSLPAINMLSEAQSSKSLDGVHTIVENSSGNTAFALGVAAHAIGIQRVMALVPWDIAPGKLDLLRLVGVDPRLVRHSPGEPSGIQQARSLGREPGFYSPSQYENAANPEAYEKWVAPQLWQQTQGRMTVFVAGLGTTGTLTGVGRYLRQHSQRIQIVGVICAHDAAVPGVRSESRLTEIQFEWRRAADAIIEVSTRESYKLSLAMCREGIMGGPSSGFALAGAHRFLDEQHNSGTLDRLRNDDGEVLVTFICPDTALPYLEKYSTHLDPSDF